MPRWPSGSLGRYSQRPYSQVLGSTVMYKYSQVKSKIWLRPLVNTVQGLVSNHRLSPLCGLDSHEWQMLRTCLSVTLTVEPNVNLTLAKSIIWILLSNCYILRGIPL